MKSHAFTELGNHIPNAKTDCFESDYESSYTSIVINLLITSFHTMVTNQFFRSLSSLLMIVSQDVESKEKENRFLNFFVSLIFLTKMPLYFFNSMYQLNCTD